MHVLSSIHSLCSPYAKKCAFTEPVTEVIPSEHLMAFPKCMSTFDLKTVTAQELSVRITMIQLTVSA